MKRQIIDFTELKAYCDIFNEAGHKGFKEPINPFIWWNHKWAGKIDNAVHVYTDEGLIVILELESQNSFDVKNMQIFTLCPQVNILKKVLDITKSYGIVKYNSDKRNRYKNITLKLGGSLDGISTNGKSLYFAKGENSWVRLYGQP